MARKSILIWQVQRRVQLRLEDTGCLRRGGRRRGRGSPPKSRPGFARLHGPRRVRLPPRASFEPQRQTGQVQAPIALGSPEPPEQRRAGGQRLGARGGRSLPGGPWPSRARLSERSSSAIKHATFEVLLNMLQALWQKRAQIAAADRDSS